MYVHFVISNTKRSLEKGREEIIYKIAVNMKKMEEKNFAFPDEVRKFEMGKVELVKVGDATIGRAIFEPGWKWSLHVKPIAKTDWCEVSHFHYQVSGRMHVVMADGTEVDLEPGSVALIPPGHDAWVVGDEPVVGVDFQGMRDYAKKT